MLFDVSRNELADVLGADRLAALPAAAFPRSAGAPRGARLLRTVGVPTGTLLLREPDEDSGRRRPAPLPGRGTVWSVAGEGIAAGMCFQGDSPGARSLHG
ncbi:SUKH-4 family immunity protein [Streptomyces sp. NPDC050422]|uniref:SUKH-4 family immunity protein n=1 Tax=Streptomyces sp. NPDC050422 TaxID=3365614 RepID=UPI0037BBF840